MCIFFFCKTVRLWLAEDFLIAKIANTDFDVEVKFRWRLLLLKAQIEMSRVELASPIASERNVPTTYIRTKSLFFLWKDSPLFPKVSRSRVLHVGISVSNYIYQFNCILVNLFVLCKIIEIFESAIFCRKMAKYCKFLLFRN